MPFPGYKVKTGSLTAMGVLQIVLGSLLSIFCLTAYMGVRLFAHFAAAVSAAANLPLLGVIGGIVLALSGNYRLTLASRCRRLFALSGTPRTLGALSGKLGRTPAALLRDISALQARGCLQNISLQKKSLTLTSIGNTQLTILPDSGMEFAGTRKAPVASYCLAGGFLLLYAALFSLSRWTDLVIAGAGAAILYLLTARTGNMSAHTRILQKKMPPPPPFLPARTGDSLADDLLRGAGKELMALAALDFSFAEEAFRAQVEELLKTARQIIDYLSKSPEKVRQVRQFLHYYLPGAAKLLISYHELGSQPVRGENIRGSMKKIEDALPGILKTFAEELDGLYLDRAVDISAEVSVMRSMIPQEGLPDIPPASQ